MRKKIIALIIIGIFLSAGSSVLGTGIVSDTPPVFNEKATSDPGRLTPQDLTHVIQYTAITLIDIRTTEAYDKGHILNAVSIPYEGCSACFCLALEPYKDKKIILYDEEGDLINQASNYLTEHGFSDISFLGAGLSAWKECTFPVVTSYTDTECDCTTHDQPRQYYTGLLTGGPSAPEPIQFSGEVPPAWDWRNAVHNGITGDWTTGIRNQGQCGSCYAFGCLAALESTMNIVKNNPSADIDLSEQFIVSCGQEWSSGIFGCDGAYFSSTFSFINTYGSIPESCFPYTSGQSGSVPACSQKCSNWQDLVLNIDGWHTVSSDITSMKNALVTYGPLTVTMTVYNDFHDYDGGVYDHPGSDPDPTNHMVAIVGYDDAQNCWIVKNSWGTGWGENGWFKITYGDCNIGEQTAYFTYTDEDLPSLTVQMHRIQMIGEIEGILEGDADWSYRIEVNNGHIWAEQINDAYSTNEDDHTQDVYHSFNIYATTCEFTIKVWDRDFWSGDDLADVSGYEGGGVDNDITDQRGAIYHGTYNLISNQLIPIDTVITDGGYLTTSGTYAPDNGDNSDEENDAKVWFQISDNYEPPTPDLQVTGSLSGSATHGATQYNLGSFTVENIGVDPHGFGDSYLDWAVATTPSWGTNWNLVPNSGTDLPSTHPITVNVYVDVPEQQQTFSGEIKIWNTENHADFGVVPVQLTVPMDQEVLQIPLQRLLFLHFFFS